MALTNSPLVNLLTGQPITTTPGFQLVNPGGGSGTSSSGNAVYNALTGTNTNPITSTSPTATPANNTALNFNNLFFQILVGIMGVVLIILGLVMIGKTDLKAGIIKG